MGLQGYSSPTPHHVIFAVECGLIGNFRFMLDGMFPDVVELRGRYNGQDEVCFAAAQPVFDEIMRRWPMLFANEDSVLILGTPQSMNRRPAKLRFLRDAMYKGNAYVRDAEIDMGMFMSVTGKEAHAAGDFTQDPERGLFWVCRKNPSDSVAEDEHRALTEVMVDLLRLLGGMVTADNATQIRYIQQLGRCTDYSGVLQWQAYSNLVIGHNSAYDRVHDMCIGRRREDGTIIDKKNIYYLVPKGVKA